jgi:ATP/maltotriose-dependent transcriptional regulator MalT
MWWLRCEFTAAEDALRRSLGHAERARAQRDLSRARYYLALAAIDGPTPLEDALRRCREIREQAAGDLVVEAGVGYTIASGEAMRGRFDEARDVAARSTAIYEELGLQFALATWCIKPGAVELLAGEPAAAERILRSGYEALASVGEKVNLSLIAASLAEAVHLQGRGEEAEQLTVVSEESTSPEDVWSQVAWRSARASILAARGASSEAERLAREAVDLISGTDALNMRAAAMLALARAVGAAGRADQAAACVGEALRLYEAKGNVVAAGTARALLSDGALMTGAA